MGVSLNKFLGYGLKDLRWVDDQLADPRINNDSPIFEFANPEFKEYAQWLIENSCCQRHKSSEDPFSLDLFYIRDHKEDERPRRFIEDCYTWTGEEYGLREVICLQPLSSRDWQRRDDSIDYMTETCLGPQPFDTHSRVESIKHGVFPWNGAYMDSRTGQELDSEIMYWVRATNAEKPLSTSDMDLLAKAVGFADNAEAAEFVAPIVPGEIRDLASYFELFTADDVWQQLRPMLYTYWA